MTTRDLTLEKRSKEERITEKNRIFVRDSFKKILRKLNFVMTDNVWVTLLKAKRDSRFCLEIKGLDGEDKPKQILVKRKNISFDEGKEILKSVMENEGFRYLGKDGFRELYRI